MNRIILVIVIIATGGIVILLLAPQIAYSNPVKSDSTNNFGVGFQSAPFPIFGLGVVYKINQNLSIQGIGRVGLDVDFLALRALYHFKKKSQYSIYVNGVLGFFRDPDVSESIFAAEESDEALGFGLGGGFEYFFKSLPDIGWNVEVDFIHIDFEEKWWDYDYKSFSLLMVGLGVHYYF